MPNCKISTSELLQIRRACHAIAVIALLGAQFFVGGAEAARTLRVVTWAVPKSPHQVAIQEFAKLVQERTRGGIAIQVVDGTNAGVPIREGLKQIQSGQLDGAVIPISLIATVFPKIAALSFPFLFADYEHVDKTMSGDVGTDLLRQFSEVTKVRGLGYLENGFLDLGSTHRPVKTSADLRGLKILSSRQLSQRSFAALGASTTLIDFAELPVALRSGLADTAELMLFSGSAADLQARAFAGVVKYASLTEHSYLTSVLAFNAQVLDGLPGEQRRVVLESAKESAILNGRLTRDGKKRALQELEKGGITLVVPDRTDLRRSLDRLFQNPPPDISKEVLDLIIKVCRLPPFCGKGG